MKIPFPLVTAGLLAGVSAAPAALSNYWPLDGNPGDTAVANAAPGAVAGELFSGSGSDWVIDDEARGKVLNLAGAGDYVNAALLPELAPETPFTWSFWANAAAADPFINNNIILGNRFPDAGWMKFTTTALEYRDITPTFNHTIDYPDFAVDTWVHHAAVKSGNLLTYYRNGIALGNNWVTGTLPADTPLYFGGDTTNESWAGLLDDAATWTNALPAASVSGLARGEFAPPAAPLTYTVPALREAFTEDFSGTLDKWTAVNRGLEQNGPAGFSAPATVNGQLVLGGTSTAPAGAFWFGSSLETKATFDSTLYNEISVKRSALTGAGTARRSSLWIFGDAGHYLHLSQNLGETGWTWNAQDAGGAGTNNPTGGGANMGGLDALDADAGEHTLAVRFIPTGTAGSVNMELLVDGTVHAIQGFTTFPSRFRVILSGQARAGGDTVRAVFDDVKVLRQVVPNLAPVFSTAGIFLPSGAENTPYTAALAGFVSDPDGDALTFSKVSGPDWLAVDAQGNVSGTPHAGELYAQAEIAVSDGKGGDVNTPVSFRISGAAAGAPAVFGWWPLNQTGGSIATEATGAENGGRGAAVANPATGGLGTAGSAWRTDGEFGQVFSSNGTDGSGASAAVGAPPASGMLPVLDAATDFSWSFWAKPNQGADTAIILGNRYGSESNTDLEPRQFVKFTSAAFEWHANATGENIDYPDLEQGFWAHHAVVKKGDVLYYYRNGALAGVRTITLFPDQPLPVYFAGQNGVEVWSGSLHDVRLYSGALSDADLAAVVQSRGQFPATAPVFTSSVIGLPDAVAGTPYSQSIAASASDPQAGPLTFSLVSGPAWLSVTPQGVLSGTPDDASKLVEASVQVKDNQNITAGALVRIRVSAVNAPAPAVFGAWPLNDGSGDQAADTGGAGNTVVIANADTGGLGPAGSVWVADAQRGTVLSFEGTDATGAWASAGDPFDPVQLPLMNAENSFTWAFWANPEPGNTTEIILGNRYDAGGVDFAPVQFIKFTTLSFEWYLDGTQQGIDYPDLEPGVWAHHAVVKDGDTLFYYRNGVLLASRAVTIFPDQQMPLYFGGQGPNGVENWRGRLSDVRLYNGALNTAAVDELAKNQGTPPASGLQITGITRAADGSVTLQWNAAAGKTYTVSGSRSLSGFQVLSTNAAATHTLPAGNAVLNPAVEPRLFFRVTENR